MTADPAPNGNGRHVPDGDLPPPRLSGAALVEVELAALGAAFVGTAEESHRVLSETSDAHYTGHREIVFRALRIASVDGMPDPTAVATTLRGWKAQGPVLEVLHEAVKWPTAAGLDRTLELLEEARQRREEVAWVNRIAGAETDDARVMLFRKAQIELAPNAAPAKRTALVVRSLKDAMALAIPRHDWFVPGLVGRKRMTLLTAPPKLGKSLAAFDLAVKLASGMAGTWLGTDFPMSTGYRTLYLCAEGGIGLLQERAGILAKDLAAPALELIDVVAERPWPRLDTERGLADLRRALERAKYDLVIVDPLARFRDLEGENDNAVTQRFAENFRNLVLDFDAASVLVHHPSKLSASDREGTTFGGGRGASALLGEVDVAISLRKPPDKGGEIHAYFELRDSAPIEPGRRFVLDPATLRLEYQGDLGAAAKPRQPSPDKITDMKWAEALRDAKGWVTRERWAQIAGASDRSLERALSDGLLDDLGDAVQTDRNGPKRAFRYRWTDTSDSTDRDPPLSVT